jgi:AcrR family transcriptional regulator
MRGVNRRLPRVGQNERFQYPGRKVPEVPSVVTQTSPSPVGPLRRVPVQGRSLARVHRMLDACAELVDEVGYEGLTTTLLAERAAVAIGSVYQFFPDKRAIVQALAMRNVDAYVARVSTRIQDGSLTDWADAVDVAMDEYIDMHRTTPGFRTLHFGDVVDRYLLDEERDNDTVIAEQLGGLLVQGFGLADSPVLRLSLSIAVELGDALVKLAFRRDPDGDPAILNEARKLVREYLTRNLS